MSRSLLLSLLLLPGVALAQDTIPTVPTAPEPGDLTQPTPPIVPPLRAVPIPPPVTLPPPPTPSPDAPPEVSGPLTADEAARIALRLQPDVTVAAAQIEAARGRTAQQRSGLRPSLNLGGTFTQQESLNSTGGGGGGGVPDPFSTSSSSGLRLSAGVEQLLFDFNRTRNFVRAAAARERAAGANLTRVQGDLVLSVKQAFYTLAQNQRLVSVNEANLKNRQEQSALAQARLNTGLGAPGDVVRAQTAVAEAAFDLETARNDAENARVNLALLMGIDARTPLQISDSGEAPLENPDVNALVESALTQRPEIAQALANLQAAGFDVSAARRANAPGLSVNVGAASRGNALTADSSSVRASLSLSWSPFDGGLTKGLVQEARANAAIAQAQLESARQSVRADVSRAYLDLRTAERRVITADAQVANAEEGVRLAEGRYRAGVATFIEVTDAQAALLSARTNRVNSQASVEQARAALSRAVGAPLR